MCVPEQIVSLKPKSNHPRETFFFSLSALWRYECGPMTFPCMEAETSSEVEMSGGCRDVVPESRE